MPIDIQRCNTSHLKGKKRNPFFVPIAHFNFCPIALLLFVGAELLKKDSFAQCLLSFPPIYLSLSSPYTETILFKVISKLYVSKSYTKLSFSSYAIY